MTKKELIGRKFVTDNGRGRVHDIFDNSNSAYVDIALESDKGNNKHPYLVSKMLGYINDGTGTDWKLLPEEPKTYTTPKGIKYGVGDVYSYAGKQYTVERLETDRFWCEEGGFFNNVTCGLKLVSKANKQQVIGYELLKDLPGIPAGTQSKEKFDDSWKFASLTKDKVTLYVVNVQDTTWFKPIYKVKEGVVKISGGREVVINGDKLSIENGAEFCSTNQFNNIHQLQHTGHIATGRKSYSFEATAYKIGCFEITKKDIELVYQAIQNIK